MKAGTLCLIEPQADALPDEARQLGGLMVTTHKAGDFGGGHWDVLPAAVMRYRHATRSIRGTLIEAGKPVEILVPSHWLKPIGGSLPATPAATPVESGA